ncbi:2-keto-4-pentenoate hydratase/2-oxohepta-3-ene-1,7-dioic acid hydratase (catechol pathway) [Rhizobiales bacterium GAS188]|jgi:2-keto-4-pentenoate hydratase/2-oxohepta-3-ene-1,7-dioic acid hydratase in catechol pathway|nr:2-keto-4-pentenoate hydratase/2-oxohepta-3-ene-1,7-dioic acid hydratase (catechol pathway) [Rhizobiales bacterium GAS188]
MQLVTFEIGGENSYGIVVEGGIIDAGRRLGRSLPDIEAVLAAGALGRLAELSAHTAPDFALDQVRLRKPLLRPGKIICVGVNYPDRNAEYKDGSEPPIYPSLFVRFPASLVADGEALIRPIDSPQLDYEGEVAIIIGQRGRRIDVAQAMSHVAGYTVCNEGTVRDWIRHGKFNVTQGKNFEASGSLGPIMVTADEIGGRRMRIVTKVNGEVRQDDTTDRMIFKMPTLIAYISRFCTLEPGDIIVSGTPVGAGARFNPPRYLKPGDVVTVEVEGVGRLENPVEDEPE